MKYKLIQWIITLVAIGAVFIHLYLPDIEIDGVTVLLLSIALLPWLAPLFKSVELPGGLKVEFQQLEDAEKKIEDSGLVKSDAEPEKKGRHVYAFEAVASGDPNLALAGLRIEIESRLREIAKSNNLSNDRAGLRALTNQLRENGILEQKEAAAISDLLPLLNKAYHGAEVDPRAFQWALEFGPRILNALEEKLGEEAVPKLVEQWKGRDGTAVAEVGTELSKSLIQSPKAFLTTMKKDQESFSSWLEDIRNHTFTIYEATDELEDDMYTAYYERLKQLMIEAVEPLVGTELDAEAKRVLNVLSQTNVTRIW